MSGTADFGPSGMAAGAGFRAEAAAVQVPFQLNFEREFELFDLKVEVSGAGNLGGIGGSANAGAALTTRGVRGYLEGGLTPVIGGRVRIGGSIDFNQQFVTYMSNPDNNPLAPIGSWIGQKLYDLRH
jgi:hypothetical protein